MFDLVVIGAGLSGLQAAYSAHQAGLSVVVLEARDRVGGKTWSEPIASGRGIADLGAAWMNEETQPRVTAYVNKFGLHTVKQRLEGKAILQDSTRERIEYPFGITPYSSTDDKQNLEYIRDHIQAVSLKHELPKLADDNVTLDQYVRNLGARPKTCQMVNLWSRVMHGVESSEQTAAWFIDYCRRNRGLLSIRADDRTGGNYQRIHEGTQSIALGIANLFGTSNIHLSSPVISIYDANNRVAVTTTTGNTFIGKKCILSVPCAMYKDFNFYPPLPQRLREMSDSAFLGDYNKAILIYDRPWWRDLGYNGFFMSFDGPACLARDTSVDDNRFFSLTCFVNGKNGREWSRLYPHERRKTLLKQLAHVYNQDTESELFRPMDYFDQIWMHEKYSQGALASMTAPGHYTEYADVYGKPVGNLHFVGTEYSREWKGYMEGALCSGEAGAQEVVESLRGEFRSKF